MSQCFLRGGRRKRCRALRRSVCLGGPASAQHLVYCERSQGITVQAHPTRAVNCVMRNVLARGNQTIKPRWPASKLAG
jgi:hypothetical protein